MIVAAEQPCDKSYEMGYTPNEFSKTLHGQFVQNQTDFKLVDNNQNHWQIIFPKNQAIVDIKISESTPRKIALLSLPVLEVCFCFSGINAQEQALFLKRFFKYFHKGGG